MRTSHTILLRIWYDPACDFSQVVIDYVSRGTPGNQARVTGTDVISLDAEYFTRTGYEESVCIPYHRIQAIWYQDRLIWRRPG